jgi:hypothetical protein
VYSKLERAIQDHLYQARLKEWNYYVEFGAVDNISRREAEDLISQGIEALPHAVDRRQQERRFGYAWKAITTIV